MASVNFLYRSKKDEAFLNVRLLFRLHNESFPNGYRDIVIGARTQLKVSRTYWNKQHNLKRVKDISIANQQTKINNELNKIENYILNEFNSVSADSVNKDWLQALIHNYYNPPKQNKIPINLIDYIDFYIEYRKNELKETSIKKFKVIKHKLERFETYRKRQILIKDINDEFKNEFVNYLIEHLYSKNTRHREFVFIKTFCKHARFLGVETHPQLDGLSLERDDEIQNIYLSFDELETIEAKEMPHEHLDNSKDWLIISCFTGQRVSDFMRFTSKMLREENGKNLIEFKQKKTDKLMTIPVHPKVQVIINKRKGEFPRAISDQKYNDYIKIVCQLSGLKQKVKGKLQINIAPEGEKSKIRRVAGTYEKWELVSSHIGRRSFATNFYGYNNIPTSYLIAVTGHTTEAAFLNYIGKGSKELAMELTKYF